jgi:para-nitrobenzyl esterase
MIDPHSFQESFRQRSAIDRRAFLRAGATVALGAAFAQRAFALPDRVSPVVKTTNGPVRGLTENNVHSYLGVRYGAPPVGSLRFMPPRRPEPWTGVSDTMRYAHSAMQLASGGSAVGYPGNVGPALGQVFGSREDVLRQHEDCLALNVWSRGLGDGKDRPVLVWLHGGGFNYGSGSWPAYDGHNLALHYDVVVVTVNHRLNAFGYLNLAPFGGEAHLHSANAGHLDLVASLEWVRDNIAAFGGDPGNVTIFGQSGGGAKVCNLLATPAARGLFHKASIQSGSALRSGDPETSAATAEKLLAELGIPKTDVAALQEVPAEKLLAAAAKASRRYGPVMDGDVIAHHPFDPAASPLAAAVPVMVGCTQDEQTLYNCGHAWWRDLTDEGLIARIAELPGEQAEALLAAFRELRPDDPPRYHYTNVTSARVFGGSVRLAERKSAQSTPVYLWVYRWHAPVDDGILRAPHTIEIPFVFHNVDKGPILLGEAPDTRRLEQLTSAAWVAFARTGNPSTPELPWPAYDPKRRATMVFDTEPALVDDYMAPVREILGRSETPRPRPTSPA